MIYLNNAATSYPKPKEVGEAVKSAIDRPPYAAHRASFSGEDTLEHSRVLLSELMSIQDPSRIVLTQNATAAIDIALFGFDFKKGDVVLTTATEHNSVLRPLHALVRRGLVKTVFVEPDQTGRISPAAWERAAAENKPKMAVFSHASNVTGAIQDAEALTQSAKAHGAKVLVDAAQTLGLIDVLPEKWGVDMLAFTGHKYLLGPQGTGGLYVSGGLSLSPVLIGGTGIHSDDMEMPGEMPLRLEAGTPNEHGFAGLCAALKWAKENPRDSDALFGLAGHLADGLKQAGAKVFYGGAPSTPVISFLLSGYTVEDAAQILYSNYDIVLRSGLHCSPYIHRALGTSGQGTLRASLSRFTSNEEINALIAAVKEMLS